MNFLQEISRENFYIVYNGRLATDFDTLSTGSANITPRIVGGKGGFGSMLRAIGAQIEKTTNREACRDLSGRRLRDINEEKRLKLWIEKEQERKESAAERKKKKLEKLCSEPKYKFVDPEYDHERSVMPERVADSVTEGFKARKRIAETEDKIVKKKKVTLGFGFDLDSDELDSSDDDSDKNVSDEASVSVTNNSNDVTILEKSEQIYISETLSVSEKNSENSPEKAGSSECKKNVVDEECNDEKTDSNDVIPDEKLKLAVSN